MTRVLLTIAILAAGTGLVSCAPDPPMGNYGSSSRMSEAVAPVHSEAGVPPMAEKRAIDDEDCAKAMQPTGGNLRCK